MSELKPCPFCGVSVGPHYEQNNDGDGPATYVVWGEHPDNGCIMGGWEIEREDFDLWNERADAWEDGDG